MRAPTCRSFNKLRLWEPNLKIFKHNMSQWKKEQRAEWGNELQRTFLSDPLILFTFKLLPSGGWGVGVREFQSCKKSWNDLNRKIPRSFWHLKVLPLNPSPTTSLLCDLSQVTYFPRAPHLYNRIIVKIKYDNARKEPATQKIHNKFN